MYRNMKLEALITILNRLSGPISVFAATAFLSRYLDSQFQILFLLSFSISQWSLQFGFQWIKNSIIKTAGCLNFWSLKLTAALISSVAVCVFVIFSVGHSDVWVGISASAFVISCGIIYILTTTCRLSGYILYPQVIEIFAVTIRWFLGCYFCIQDNNIALLFATMAAVNLMFSIPLLICSNKCKFTSEKFQLKKYLTISFWLLLTDISASTFMYLDRVIVKDASYIIYSILGNQSATVVLGAATAATLPRIAISYHSGMDWRNKHRSYLKYILGGGVVAVLGACIFAPFAIHILSPETPSNRLVVALFSFSQAMHFIYVYISVQLLFAGKNWIVALVYLMFMFSYFVGSIYFLDNPLVQLPYLRCVLMALMVFVSFTFFSLNTNKWNK